MRLLPLPMPRRSCLPPRLSRWRIWTTCQKSERETGEGRALRCQVLHPACTCLHGRAVQAPLSACCVACKRAQPSFPSFRSLIATQHGCHRSEEPAEASTSGAAAAAAAGAAGGAAGAGEGAGAAGPSGKPGLNLVSPREAAAKLKNLLPVGRGKSERAELLAREAAAGGTPASPSAGSTRDTPGGASTSGGGWAAAGKGGKAFTRTASEIKRAYGRPTASRCGCGSLGLGWVDERHRGAMGAVQSCTRVAALPQPPGPTYRVPALQAKQTCNAQISAQSLMCASPLSLFSPITIDRNAAAPPATCAA